MDRTRRKWWWRSLTLDIVALGLAAITWVLFAHVDAFGAVGGELLKNPSFESGLAGWHVSRDAVRSSTGLVDLSGHKASLAHIVSQTLPRPATGYLRVTVDADVRDVVRGPKPWQSARIDVMGLDAKGHEHWDFPHKLIAMTGSRKLRGVSKVFKIPAAYKQVRIEAELVGATGTFVVRRLSATEARPLGGVALAKKTVLMLWSLFIVLVVLILSWSRAWALIFALLPGGALLLFIPDAIRHFVEHIVTVNGLHLSLDHLSLFMVMTWLALRDDYVGGWLEPIVHLAVLGVIVEAIQYYLPGRSSEFVDILSDWLGIWFAVLGYEVMLRLRGPGLKRAELHL